MRPEIVKAHLFGILMQGAGGNFRLAEEFGSKRVSDLKPNDFDQWLTAQTRWNPSSKAYAATLILNAVW